MKRNSLSCKTALAFLAIGLVSAPSLAAAQASPVPDVKNVLLVHGAFADGSSWSKVIPSLQGKGFHVVAVQIPLTSLADDVAAVHRAIALEHGPVLLVGHSYGGVVITEAGSDPKVAGLVYVAAFAPDAGESVLAMAKNGPTPPLASESSMDDAGFLKVTEKGFQEDFAQDLPEAERSELWAIQVPINGFALNTPVTRPAWKEKPTSYVVASLDRAIPPQAEQAMAARMHADITTVSSSHPVMLSHPDIVTKVIEDAARQSYHVQVR